MTHRDQMVRRVLERYLRAGDVVNLPSNKHVVTIAARKYVLSNDGGPLGIHEDEDGQPSGGMIPSGGAKLILGPAGDRWKYLWVYDTDKQILVMWRVTDGNEKHWSTARSEQQRIVRLEKKRQLNRVDHETFVRIEREMQNRARDNEKALLQYIRDNESDLDKRINQLAEEYFDREVRPEIEHVVASIGSGVVPLGFKPHSPEHQERQKLVYMIGKVLERKFTTAHIEAYLNKNGITFEHGGDVQQVDWAKHEITDRMFDEFLPARD